MNLKPVWSLLFAEKWFNQASVNAMHKLTGSVARTKFYFTHLHKRQKSPYHDLVEWRVSHIFLRNRFLWVHARVAQHNSPLKFFLCDWNFHFFIQPRLTVHVSPQNDFDVSVNANLSVILCPGVKFYRLSQFYRT